MSFKYEYKTDPFQHQRDELNYSWRKNYRAIHWTMGLGKSKLMIDNASALYRIGEISLAVVITKKGVHSNWAQIEVPKHSPISTQIFEWNTYRCNLKDGKKEMEDFLRSIGSYNAAVRENEIGMDRLRWLCINIETMQRPKSKGLIYTLKCIKESYGNCLIILDEAAMIKDPKSNRTQNVVKLAQYARFRRTLTGTPITESPFNIWPQSEFLSKGLSGFSSYFKFCNHYGQYNVGYAQQGRTFRKLEGYRNLDELRSKISSWATEKTKKECLDLPPKIYELYRFYMTEEQAAIYEEMLYMGNLFFNKGRRTVSAAENPLTRRMKLYQIVSGYVICDDNHVMSIKHNRVTALLELIEEMKPEKLVIYSGQPYCIREIYRHLIKEYDRKVVTTLYGDTEQQDRIDRVKDFQDGGLRFLIANQQVAGHGLTLTATKNMVYYTNRFSLDMRVQSEDRAHRIGQHNPVTYTDMLCHGTVDLNIIHSLRNKVDVASQGTKLAEDWLAGHKQAFERKVVLG